MATCSCCIFDWQCLIDAMILLGQLLREFRIEHAWLQSRYVVRSSDAAVHTLHRLTPYSQIAHSCKNHQSGQAVPKHHLGAMSHTCTECGAHHWLHEATESKAGQHKFGMCCQKGAIQLPALQATPPVLKALLQGDTPESQGFLARQGNTTAVLPWHQQVGISTNVCKANLPLRCTPFQYRHKD